MYLLNKVIEKFCFALTGSSLCNLKHIEHWYWYCSYLECRAASAWVLCTNVLIGVTAQTATDCIRAKCALYASFAIVAECMLKEVDIGFTSVIEQLRASGLVHDHTSNDDAIAFAFQVVGWVSAMWDPSPAQDLPHLRLRYPQTQSRRRAKSGRRSTTLTVMDIRYQTVRRTANRLGAPIPVPVHNFDDESMQSRDVESASITTAYLSYHSLKDLVKVKLVWTNTLVEHLKYDSRTKSLYIFKYPSLCLIMLRADGDTILSSIFEAERQEMNASELHSCSATVGFEDYLIEVILSYQLIFALHKDSRKYVAQILDSPALLSEQGGIVDPLLRSLCTEPPTSNGMVSLYTELELERYENHISISDVPFLAKKLRYLESVSKGHTPNSLRRLWMDRRNPTTWFALWAVLIIGVGTLILQFFQLVFQIYQPPIGG